MTTKMHYSHFPLELCPEQPPVNENPRRGCSYTTFVFDSGAQTYTRQHTNHGLVCHACLFQCYNSEYAYHLHIHNSLGFMRQDTIEHIINNVFLNPKFRFYKEFTKSLKLMGVPKKEASKILPEKGFVIFPKLYTTKKAWHAMVTFWRMFWDHAHAQHNYWVMVNEGVCPVLAFYAAPNSENMYPSSHWPIGCYVYELMVAYHMTEEMRILRYKQDREDSQCQKTIYQHMHPVSGRECIRHPTTITTQGIISLYKKGYY